MEKNEVFGLYPYRWVVLASFMFVAALTQLMWLNYAPITSQTQRLMGGLSEFKIVLLATMFPLLYIPVSIPAGFIIDRKGFRYAVLLGAGLTAGFSFLRLFVNNYPLVLIGMIGIAIGQPLVLNSVTKLVSAWFPTEESALATGLATLSLFLGMIVALALTPPLLKTLGENDPGSLKMIVLIYSIAAVIGFLLFVVFGRAKPPLPPKRTEEEVLGEEAAIDLKSIGTISRLHNFRLLSIIIFIGNGAFVGILQLIEKIMKPKGITAITAGNIGAAMVVAGVVGCIVIPTISDKLMRRKPFVIVAAAVAIPTLFLIAALEGVGEMFVIGCAMGFFLFSAYPIVLTYAEETTGKALTGTATSMLLLLGNAGGVVLTLLMEAIKGATGGKEQSFFWAIMLLVGLFAVALIVALFLKETPVHEPIEASG